MFEFTEAEKEFFKKRDKEIDGLQKCQSYITSNQLSNKGCALIKSEKLIEANTSYEYYVYKKHNKKIVYYEVYTDQEGGIYHQNLYTQDGIMP